MHKRFEILEQEKWQYCCQEETVKDFIIYFMQPTLSEYYDTYNDTNWLHCALDGEDGDYNALSMDALALLMGQNVIVLDEMGEVVHQKIFFLPLQKIHYFCSI